MLVKLQHHAAARLIDFSKNALVALFFCAEGSHHSGSYGLLFGIHTDIISGHEDEFDFDLRYDDFVKLADESNHVHAIALPPISARISAQHSILLSSKYVDGNARGSLYLDDDAKYHKFIAISPQLDSVDMS